MSGNPGTDLRSDYEKKMTAKVDYLIDTAVNVLRLLGLILLVLVLILVSSCQGLSHLSRSGGP